jgi:hypothetical protein
MANSPHKTKARVTLISPIGRRPKADIVTVHIRTRAHRQSDEDTKTKRMQNQITARCGGGIGVHMTQAARRERAEAMADIGDHTCEQNLGWRVCAADRDRINSIEIVPSKAATIRALRTAFSYLSHFSSLL